MKFPDVFRHLPHEAISRLTDLLSQPQLTQGLRDAASELGSTTERGFSQLQGNLAAARRWLDQVTRRMAAQTPQVAAGYVNATGSLLDGRFSPPTISESAVAAAAGYLRGHVHVPSVLRELQSRLIASTGAESVVILPSLGAAVHLLALHPAILRWGLPRAAATRLPQLFDAAAVLRRSGHAVELGSANRLARRDLQPLLDGLQASGQQQRTTGWFSVCPSAAAVHEEYRGVDEAIADAWQAESIYRVELNLGATLCDVSAHLPQSVTIRSRLTDCDAVLVPADLWMGGPACAVLCGSEQFCSPVANLAEDLGLNCDPLQLLTLLGNVEASSTIDRWLTTAIGELCSTTLANQKHRAQRLHAQLKLLPALSDVDISETSRPIGPQPLDLWQWSSVEVGFRCDQASEFTQRLQRYERPIELLRDGDRCFISLRTVEPSDDLTIIDAIEACTA